MKKIVYAMLAALFLFTLFSGCGKNDPKQIVTNKQEIEWITNIDSALTISATENKPVIIDFMATWCPPCKRMEDSTFSDNRVIEKTKSFITVRIDVDKHQDIANKYNSNANKYGGIGIPNTLFLDKNGRELKHPIGFLGPNAFIAVMDSVLIINSEGIKQE